MFNDLIAMLRGLIPSRERPEPAAMSTASLKRSEMAEFMSIEGSEDGDIHILVLRKGKKLLWQPMTDESLKGILGALTMIAKARGLL